MKNLPTSAAEAGSTDQTLRTGRLLLTLPEAAESLRIGKSTLYELIAGGELRSVRIGRSRRISVDSLAAYVAQLDLEAE